MCACVNVIDAKAYMHDCRGVNLQCKEGLGVVMQGGSCADQGHIMLPCAQATAVVHMLERHAGEDNFKRLLQKLILTSCSPAAAKGEEAIFSNIGMRQIRHSSSY